MLNVRLGTNRCSTSMNKPNNAIVSTDVKSGRLSLYANKSKIDNTKNAKMCANLSVLLRALFRPNSRGIEETTKTTVIDIQNRILIYFCLIAIPSSRFHEFFSPFDLACGRRFRNTSSTSVQIFV